MSKGVDVDIHVKPNGNGGYLFSMEQGGNGTKQLVFDKKQDKMKKSDNYEVTFKLHNEGGADLVFSKVVKNVMWAVATPAPSDECPPEYSSFAPFYVDPASYIQDYALKVINTDPSVQCFSFCLNFVPKGTVEGPNTKYIPYDPIGINKNGGSGAINPFIVGAIAAAVVILFAAYELGFFAH